MNNQGQLAKSNLWARQSAWTTAEAIAWAEEYYEEAHRWPSQRFRVESPYGNSRLLGPKAADKSQARYGGKVVELIPSRKDYLRGRKKPT
jgi:hypothetical protein